LWTYDEYVGDKFEVDLFWESLESIPLADYVMYLSLSSQGDSTPLQPYSLIVTWFPARELENGQRALGIYQYEIPRGTTPGRYSVRLMLYSIRSAKNLLVFGGNQEDRLEIAEISVESAN
jgi:hypothetical protein